MKNIILEKYKEMLNEKSILNDEFWKWFGDSKVVDSNGNPLVVYHGTPDREFTEFDINKPKLHRKTENIGGIYFTSNQMDAGNYRKGGRIIPVYLKIENPLDITPLIKKYRKKGLTFMEAKHKSHESLDKNIHDGIIFEGNSYNVPEYVVFSPNQIKSIDNRGTWSSNTNNIYESIIDTIKYKNETMEIYENPSYNEWKHINNHSRGIISPVGNLYMTNVLENVNAKPSDILHTDILNALFSGQSSKNFVMVEKNNGSIVLSATDRNDPRAKEYFSKCKEKNPHLNFINNISK